MRAELANRMESKVGVFIVVSDRDTKAFRKYICNHMRAEGSRLSVSMRDPSVALLSWWRRYLDRWSSVSRRKRRDELARRMGNHGR